MPLNIYVIYCLLKYFIGSNVVCYSCTYQKDYYHRLHWPFAVDLKIFFALHMRCCVTVNYIAIWIMFEMSIHVLNSIRYCDMLRAVYIVTHSKYTYIFTQLEQSCDQICTILIFRIWFEIFTNNGYT